jgi:signal transduction histidine kinase
MITHNLDEFQNLPVAFTIPSETRQDLPTGRAIIEPSLFEENMRLRRELAELKSQNAELENRQHETQAGRDELNQLLLIVAHELRSPVQNAIGFNRFMLEGKTGPLSSQQEDFLSSSATTLEHIQLLLEDLLCRDQLEEGRFKAELSLVEFSSLIKELVSQFNPLAITAGVTIETFFPEGASHVFASRSHMKQCLHNLIVNAIKFSPNGGIVKIELVRETSRYLVKVTDQGCGIDPDRLKHIFERYSRNSDSHIAGYGLGLSITKQLVEYQKGSIGVKSKFGQGSQFWISMPRADNSACVEEGEF